ncbi:MAG: DUF3662 domain-containing protein [Mycobacteriaceae bacterium]|nr:DUF3662 domain-containing protein [Mycobacteriaceae bacterium]
MGSHKKGLVQRIERKLEATVDDAVARIFGGSIVRQEVEAMLRREATDGLRSLHGNHLLAPNEYIITLGVHDFDKIGIDPDLTSDAVAGYLTSFIYEQGWQTYGDVVVRFEQSSSLRTGQFRVRGAINPDVESRPADTRLSGPQPDHTFSPEPGAPLMTENSRYRAGQGQPGDDYPEPYQDPYQENRYGRQADDSYVGPDPRAGQDPRGGYPPQPGYPPPRRPDQGGYPDPAAYPEQSGYPEQRRYAPQWRYPDYGAYPPGQGSYPEPGQPGQAPSYEQRPPAPPADYSAPGYDPSYRQGPGGYPSAEQRPPYPEQGGGYEQGYPAAPGYGRPEYGPGEYHRYGDVPSDSAYAPPAGYTPPPARDYDYGQSFPPGEYGQAAAPVDYDQSPTISGYSQGGYAPAGALVTLQLDDGSGRTYQLRIGSNVIGRGQEAQFRLPDTGVSRRHLEIRWDGQAALLSDLNSTNGTTVNNAPVQEWQLADGDVIRLGHSEIIVRMH